MGLVYPLPTNRRSAEAKEINLENIMGKTVLVVGSGGREHAIVDALSRSPQVSRIYCAPGNAGIGLQAENVPIKDTDVPGLLAFAKEKAIDLTVVGPEASLSAGIVDAFRAEGLAIFGHTAAATAIESSKEFAKELMAKYDIPTASYKAFSDFEEAKAYVASRPFPAVLKYDGLAAGKGVVIAEDMDQAEAALRSMLLDESFGKGRVVVEDFLQGPEFSFLCFVSGADVYPMPLSQDHKRAFDGDKGPNTGGMGAYTGLPFITEEDKRFAYTNILCKAASAMVAEGRPLSGVLYGGLMKTADGIKVIEFNARFGDPETEVILPLLESDIYDIFYGIACGKAVGTPVWSADLTLGVVLASKGYPGSYKKGYEIRGLDNVNAHVYHMGTALAKEGGQSTAQARNDGRWPSGGQSTLLTNGGRVLMVVGRGKSLAEIKDKVYKEIEKIDCDNLFYRKDIAHCVFDK